MTAREAPGAAVRRVLGPATDRVLAGCARHVGPIGRVTRLPGGHVSHVFLVSGRHGRVVLKVRTEEFSGIPALRGDPALIADERRALDVFGRLVPGVFPVVLGFDAAAHAMTMTETFPDGVNYQHRLVERPATVDEAGQLGRVLRRVHRAVRGTPVAIRSQGDVWFRDFTLGFVLRDTRHPVLVRTAEQLCAMPGQQLVLGDLAPKNISVTEGGVALCDLDNVHRGWPGYDVAYLLAHLLVHHITWPDRLEPLTLAFLGAYGEYGAYGAAGERGARGSEALAGVAAGVMLYRLVNGLVPYALAASAAQRERLRDEVIRRLDTGRVTVGGLVDAAGAVR